MKKNVQIFIVFMLSFLFLSSGIYAQFESGNLMVQSRMAHYQVLLDNGDVWVVGGHGTEFVALNTSEIYDGQFTLQTMNYSHDCGALVKLQNGKFLIAGGAENLGVAPGYNTAEIYDPENKTFTVTGNMKYSRTNCYGTTLTSGKVLIAGGWYNDNSLAYAEIYDPESGTFTSSPALLQPRANPMVLPTTDGGAVVFGGYEGYTANPFYQSVEYYDPSTNTFNLLSNTILPSMEGFFIYPIKNITDAFKTNDGNYVFVAYRSIDSTKEYVFLSFDPETKTFNSLNNLEISEDSTFSLIGSVLNKDHNVLYSIWQLPTTPVKIRLSALDLNTNVYSVLTEWHELPESYYPSNSSLSLLNNHQILMTGGHSKTGSQTNFYPINNTLIITAKLHASTFYVSPSGDDTNDGSEANPWKTIQGAIDNEAVFNGDTIIVKDGTYNEYVEVTKEIILKSENGYSTTTVISTNSDHSVFLVKADNVTIDGFTLYGATAYWVHSGVRLYYVNNCTIINNRCGLDATHQNWLGIMITGANNNTISNNIMSYNKCYGINIRKGASNNQIINNTITNNGGGGYGGYGIQNCEDSKSNIIRGNIIEDNETWGVRIITDGINLGNNDINDKGNNIIRNNGQYNVYNETSSTINAYYNTWGSNDSTKIDSLIYDNEEGKGEVLFSPWMDSSLPVDQVILTIGEEKSLSHKHSTTIRCEVEIPGPSEITIVVNGWQNTLSWYQDYDRVYIYNENLESIGFEGLAYKEDPFLFHMLSDPDTLITRVGKGGVYYIDFHSGNNWGWPDDKTTQNYSVVVTTKPVNDIYEPNDTLATATVVELDSAYTAYQWRSDTATNDVGGDEDYYLCNIPSDGNLRINVSDTWESVYNWNIDFDRLYIYDADGNPIGGTVDNPAYAHMLSDKEINIDIEIAGIYYVRLHSGVAYSTEPYSVTFNFESATGIENENNLPNKFELEQNYPNPFNPSTVISYGLKNKSFVSLKIYDSIGREIATLVNKQQNAGNYKVKFDASNLSSGLYFYKIIAGEFVDVKKMLLLK